MAVLPDGIEIRIDGGYGYETYSAATFVPMEVMVAIMERAGFSVIRRDAV